MKDTPSLGSQLAALRWAKTTKRERLMISRRLNDRKAMLKLAREQGQDDSSTLRTQPVRRRSRKPKKPNNKTA